MPDSSSGTMSCVSPLLLLLFVSFDLIHCSPIHSISERQVDIECNDPGSVFVSECWTRLGISSYLTDEKTGWNVTTPVCKSSTEPTFPFRSVLGKPPPAWLGHGKSSWLLFALTSQPFGIGLPLINYLSDLSLTISNPVIAGTGSIRAGLCSIIKFQDSHADSEIYLGSESRRCCLTDEPWSTCFLRLGRGLGGGDCTTMDDQTCTWDNTVSPYLDPSIAAQVRYVVKSIYGVHDFFSSYFKGKLLEASFPLGAGED